MVGLIFNHLSFSSQVLLSNDFLKEKYKFQYVPIKIIKYHNEYILTILKSNRLQLTQTCFYQKQVLLYSTMHYKNLAASSQISNFYLDTQEVNWAHNHHSKYMSKINVLKNLFLFYSMKIDFTKELQHLKNYYQYFLMHQFHRKK